MNQYYFLLVITTFLYLGCSKPPSVAPFISLSEEEKMLPENALSGMEVAEGLQVELFASEPMIVNPTNISIDEKGRVWACEAENYRLWRNTEFEGRPKGDKIVILEDTDQDGKADHKKVFYQGTDVNAALGIAVFGNKIVVALSPNVFVFTDEDGDDIPESKDTLFTGIGGVDHDHGVHAFTFGPDGKFYFNFGNNGEQLLNKNGDPVLDQLGRPIRTGGAPYRQGVVFRCNLDGSGVEVLGDNFRNPYEVTVDAFGTIWQSDNDDDGNRATRINYVMQYGNYGYRDDVTGAGWRQRRIGMHEEIPVRHWHQNDPGVVPNLLYTGAGSPTGICMYEADLLPPVFHHQILHCEALKNVVRAYPVEPKGAGYSATIVNLLQSEDQWFRPSDVAVAPDGSVFVSDWYDAGVGGHKMADIQRGRIYRIAPKKNHYKIPPLDLTTPEKALAALKNGNNPTFYLAWQQFRSWGPEAEPALRNFWSGQNNRERAKALWLLAQPAKNRHRYLREAIKDEDPNLRITAIRIASQFDDRNLESLLAEVLKDPDPAVRREATLATRYLGTPVAAESWATLAEQYDGKDRWYLEALGIGAELHSDLYFNTWKERVGAGWNTPSGKDIVWRVDAETSIPLLAEIIRDPQVSAAELPKWFRSFHFKSSPQKNGILVDLLEVAHPLQREIRSYALGQLDAEYIRKRPQVKALVNRILPSIKGTVEWLDAVENLELKEKLPDLLATLAQDTAGWAYTKAGNLLFEWEGNALVERHFRQLSLTEKNELLAKMGKINHPQALAFMQKHLGDETLEFPVRSQLVMALGSQRQGQQVLFDMLKNRLFSGNMKTAVALQLMNAGNPSIRQEAQSFLDYAKDKEGDFLPNLEELAAQSGNAESGKKTFTTYCATCHQVNGQGINFGPDLSTIGEKLAKSAIYAAIIYPSAGINFGYEGYTVTTKAGNSFTGYITSETEDEIALQMMGGVSQTLGRKEIESVDPLEQSLMTPGLHAVMSERDLVNLVEYLSGLR